MNITPLSFLFYVCFLELSIAKKCTLIRNGPLVPRFGVFSQFSSPLGKKSGFLVARTLVTQNVYNTQYNRDHPDNNVEKSYKEKTEFSLRNCQTKVKSLQSPSDTNQIDRCLSVHAHASTNRNKTSIG